MNDAVVRVARTDSARTARAPRAVGQFLAWCAARGLGLQAVAPLHVAAYIRTHPGSAPTVKQHLAALRMLGNWLDRALVSVRLYSVARVSAVIGMRRPDYFRQERQGWLRLHEKGGTRHDVPAHHRAAAALDDYLEAAGRSRAVSSWR